jgi:GDP-fucose transporter C1
MICQQCALISDRSNKWVLNATDAPLFFLWTQLVIAVALFLLSDLLRLLPDRLSFDLAVCKGLVAMVGLNVIGLRSVRFSTYPSTKLTFPSFSNYTLKYVDASFYQVARGLLLPFTVATSYIFLHTRPSLLILLACSVVTVGFFIGVFLDGTPISMTGIFFGVASSAITAVHSVVIKQSLNVVNGSALLLSWYTNLLSAVVLAPIVILMGEFPSIMKMLFGLDELLRPEDAISPLTTFIWGSMITVRFLLSCSTDVSNTSFLTGCLRLPHEHR